MANYGKLIKYPGFREFHQLQSAQFHDFANKVQPFPSP